MTELRRRNKLPRDVEKNDVFKLKMGKAYVTVTVKKVKRHAHKANIVVYQHEIIKVV